jgi:TonB family protein
MVVLATSGLAGGELGRADEAPKLLPGNAPCGYPKTAQERQIAGPVEFRATVKPDGAVEAVEIRRIPMPAAGFEDAVRSCVSQWRFEPAPGGAEGPRFFDGSFNFRMSAPEEQEIRQVLERLAEAWNAGDEAAVRELEVRRDEASDLLAQDGPFLGALIGAGAPAGSVRVELAREVASFSFYRRDLVGVRQVYTREGPAAASRETTTLGLNVIKTPRGWRFIGLPESMMLRLNAPRVGGTIREPRKLKDVKPRYPEEAKDSRIQGIVILECVISKEGKVVDVRVLRSVPGLDKAAQDAVRQWLYEPTLLDGQPVPVIMTVTVNFRLS